MKTVASTIALLLVLLGSFSVQGFSVSNPSSSVRRPDASTAVEEALKITAAFGVESKEAKVAWDIVEEMDASDNRCVVSTCLSVCRNVPVCVCGERFCFLAFGMKVSSTSRVEHPGTHCQSVSRSVGRKLVG